MRVKFRFSSDKPINLPLYHNHIIQGFIYNSFSDETFAEFLHDQGYKWEKRRFKLFSFSRLMGEFNIDYQNKRIEYQSPVEIVITSAKDRIVYELTANIIRKDIIRFGSNNLKLTKVEFVSFPNDYEKESLKINMLSPVVAYKTERINGKNITTYFSPWDEEFKNQLVNNLLKKYELVYGKKISKTEFEIDPLFSEKREPNIVMFHDFVIKGWTGMFRIKAVQELLRIAYDVGIGAKNSMGHGCFEIVE